MAYYDRALQRNPSYGAGYYHRGLFCAKNHQWADAIDDYSKALALVPNAKGPKRAYVDALCQRGLASVESRNFDQALMDSMAALKQDSRKLEAYLCRARARSRLATNGAERAGAIADYNTYLKARPTDYDVYLERAEAEASEPGSEGAIADYTTYLKVHPDSYRAYLGRGRAWRFNLDNGKALADYSKAVGLKPDAGEALVLRAEIWQVMKQPARAFADCDKALAINPKDSNAYRVRGELWLAAHNTDAALSDLNRSIEEDPDYNGRAYRARASAWRLKGQGNRAVNDFLHSVGRLQSWPRCPRYAFSRSQKYAAPPQADQVRVTCKWAGMAYSYSVREAFSAVYWGQYGGLDCDADRAWWGDSTYFNPADYIFDNLAIISGELEPRIDVAGNGSCDLRLPLDSLRLSGYEPRTGTYEADISSIPWLDVPKMPSGRLTGTLGLCGHHFRARISPQEAERIGHPQPQDHVTVKDLRLFDMILGGERSTRLTLTLSDCNTIGGIELTLGDTTRRIDE